MAGTLPYERDKNNKHRVDTREAVRKILGDLRGGVSKRRDLGITPLDWDKGKPCEMLRSRSPSRNIL